MGFSQGVKFILIGILIGAVVAALVGVARSSTAQAQVAAVPGYVQQLHAYEEFITAQVDAYNKMHSAEDAAGWSNFGRYFAQTLIVVLGAIVVIGVSWLMIELIPVLVSTTEKRRSVVRASNMDFLINYDEDGNLVARPLDKMTERKDNKILPVRVNDEQHALEIDSETGVVTDVYGDFVNFLERAVIVSPNDGATEVFPTHKEMGVSASVWDRMVNEIAPTQFKKARAQKGGAVVMQTYCAEYPTVRQMYIAACRHNIPLPASGGDW